MKHIRVFTAALLFISIFFSLVSCQAENHPAGTEAPSQSGTQASDAMPEISVYTLNIGKADCILIRTPNHLVVIDAGESETKNTVVDSIKATGTKNVDKLILTHFDSDHIGGASKILKKDTVLDVIMPDYERDSGEKRDLDSAISDCGLTPTVLFAENLTFTLDGAVFTIYPSMRNDYPAGDQYDNMMSLVITMKYGNTDFLFAGDVVGDRLAELNSQLPDTSFQFIKMPHHGSFDSYYSYAFLERFRPAYAVITCSGSQRPDNELLKCLTNVNAKSYLTLSGTVTAITDGISVRVSQ